MKIKLVFTVPAKIKVKFSRFVNFTGENGIVHRSDFHEIAYGFLGTISSEPEKFDRNEGNKVKLVSGVVFKYK